MTNSTPSPLTPAELIELGRGACPPHVMDRLRCKQIDRRTAQLATLSRLVEPEVRRAFHMDSIYVAREAKPSSFEHDLLHPLAGIWLANAVRTAGNDGHAAGADLTLGFFARLLAEAGVAATADVPVDGHGMVQLPCFSGGAWTGGERATIVVESGVARMRGVGGQVTVGIAGGAETTGEAQWRPSRGLHFRNSDRETDVVLEDKHPLRGLAFAPLEGATLDDQAADEWSRLLLEGWHILQDTLPQYASVIASELRCIVPQANPGEGLNVSASSMHTFGAIAMSRPSTPEDAAATLVHEFQHVKLHAVLDLQPLHNGDPTAQFYAPWRDDPRPIDGLLQGAYAFTGVTDVWCAARQRGGTADVDAALLALESERTALQVREAMDELESSGCLNSDGIAVLAGMRMASQSWVDNHVPDDVARSARDGCDDHRAAWQMRRSSQLGLSSDGGSWLAGLPAWWRRRPALLRQQIQVPRAAVEAFRSWCTAPVEARLLAPSEPGVSEVVAAVELPNPDLAFPRYAGSVARSEPMTVLLNGIEAVSPFAANLRQLLPPGPQWRKSDVAAVLSSQGGGIGFHADHEDVYVVQLQGSRRWRVWRPEVMPDEYRWFLLGRGGGHPVQPGRPRVKALFDDVLRPGDALYIPATFPHEGVTVEESVSVSLAWRGISPYTLLWGYGGQTLQARLEQAAATSPADYFTLLPDPPHDEPVSTFLANAVSALIDLAELGMDQADLCALLGRQLDTVGCL